MINLCLVVIATQFSETKQRETMKILMERVSRQSEMSLASGHVNNYDADSRSCYSELIDVIERFWWNQRNRVRACWDNLRHRDRCCRPRRDKRLARHVEKSRDAVMDSLTGRTPDVADGDGMFADSAIDSPMYDSSVHMTLVTPLSSPVADSCLPLIVRQFDGCRQPSCPPSSSGELSDGTNDQKSVTVASVGTEEPGNDEGDNQETGDSQTHQSVDDSRGEANLHAASQTSQHSKSSHRSHVRKRQSEMKTTLQTLVSETVRPK